MLQYQQAQQHGNDGQLPSGREKQDTIGRLQGDQTTPPPPPSAALAGGDQGHRLRFEAKACSISQNSQDTIRHRFT